MHSPCTGTKQTERLCHPLAAIPLDEDQRSWSPWTRKWIVSLVIPGSTLCPRRDTVHSNRNDRHPSVGSCRQTPDPSWLPGKSFQDGQLTDRLYYVNPRSPIVIGIKPATASWNLFKVQLQLPSKRSQPLLPYHRSPRNEKSPSDFNEPFLKSIYADIYSCGQHPVALLLLLCHMLV